MFVSLFDSGPLRIFGDPVQAVAGMSIGSDKNEALLKVPMPGAED